MKRKAFLQQTAFASAALLAPGGAALRGASATRPNILFITTDQQTADALSCTGNPYVKTPALDALAARGVRFTQSYCTYPLCTPSRASWFTSRMPHELGINANPSAKYPVKFPAENPSMGMLFQAAGYETAYAGKWHIPDPYPGMKAGAIPGFDVLPLVGEFKKTHGDEGASSGLSVDPAVADAAVAFLARPHEKPFLLSVQILNPHDICAYPELPAGTLPAPDLMAPACANTFATNQEPETLIKNRSSEIKRRKTESWGMPEWSAYRSAYYKLTQIADELMGKVFATLEKNGLRDKTLVLFTSDHGELMGAHQLTTKVKVYEESVAVPFLLAGPGIKPAVNGTHLVSGLDILPTLLDYAGLAIPPGLTGKSLRPVVEGKNPPWREYVVSESGKDADLRMVRAGQYKYIVYAQGANPEQFFDLAKDPGETINLVQAPDQKAKLEQMRSYLKTWIKETKDPFVFPIA